MRPPLPPPSSRRGFTLVEALIAMVLISAVALPASLWLYRSRANQAAWERFHAVQALEDRMHRAVLLREARDAGGPAESSGGASRLRLDLKVEDAGGERRLIGTAKDARGRTLVTLEAALFERGGR